jgi:hypothetical protein
MQEVMKFIDANQGAIGDLVAAADRQKRYYVDALEQTRRASQVLEQARRASQITVELGAPAAALMAEARGTIDHLNRVLGPVTSWHQQIWLMHETIDRVQHERVWQTAFSAQTFSRASELLEQVDLEPAGDETVPDVPEIVVEEAASAVEPVLAEIDLSVARPVVMAFIGAVVFLEVVQWSVEHPDAAELIGTAVGLAALCAGFAAKVIARIWPPPPGEGPDHPDQQR